MQGPTVGRGSIACRSGRVWWQHIARHGGGIPQRRRAGSHPSAKSKELAKMFLFFSSRLGCLGSLVLSAILTLILLAIFHVL